MNELQIFKNTEFGEIRTIKVERQVYFVASDVARALGYARPNDAINQHCRYTAKHSIPHPQSVSKTMEVNVIPKGDIFRLAANSELPGAEKFESWIFDEVLVSVEEHGAYMTPETIEKVLLNPDTIINIATQLKASQERVRVLEVARESDKPKVLFADAVSASEGTILIGELAKLLKGNGIEIGQNRLYEWLRRKGYLISRKGTDYNAPTQRAMELGLFKVKETAITHSDGHVTVNKTTKVTGKGQQYFIDKFLSSNEAAGLGINQASKDTAV